MRVVMVAGLFLVCGWAWSQERVEVKRYEVGVTPQMASSVDSTLTAVAAQVPEVKALLEKAGSQASGLVVLYYTASVRRYTVIGAIQAAVGVLLLALSFWCYRGAKSTQDFEFEWVSGIIGSLVIGSIILGSGVCYLASPQYYAMLDVVGKLVKVVGR